MRPSLMLTSLAAAFALLCFASGASAACTATTTATQAQVSHVRLKPRGAMAAGSNFKIAVADTVK